MSDAYQAFLAQAGSLPALLGQSATAIIDGMRLVLPTEDIYAIRQIVLCGSGDSHIAAEAAALAIRSWTGLAVAALPAMEAARYLDTGRPLLAGRQRGLLFVAISSSGEAARVVEATRRMRRFGAVTVAVTAHPDSRLGQAAEKRIDIAIPTAPPAPGTRSHVAALVGAYALGLRIAEVLMCMTMDAANALRAEIAGLGASVAAATEAAATAAGGLDWRSATVADCLGSGPSLASARYLSAKLIEAAGLHAAAVDAEEFHHLNYFVDDPARIPTVLFAPASAEARSRQRELVDTLDELGRPRLVFTDDAVLIGRPGVVAIPPVRELFAPILHCGVGAVLAAEAARARGAVHYRGHDGPWRGARNAGLVRNSAILMAGEEA